MHKLIAQVIRRLSPQSNGLLVVMNVMDYFKLGILPQVSHDMVETLSLLCKAWPLVSHQGESWIFPLPFPHLDEWAVVK